MLMKRWIMAVSLGFVAVLLAAVVLPGCAESASSGTTATPSTSTRPIGFTGSASWTDATRDAVQMSKDGIVDAPEQVVGDLVGASLGADGQSLTIVLDHVSALPKFPLVSTAIPLSEGQLFAMSWLVSIDQAGTTKKSLFISAMDTWRVSLTEGDSASSRDLTIVPKVDGKRLTIVLPLAELGELAAPFEWNVLTGWTFRGSGGPETDLEFVDFLTTEGVTDTAGKHVDFPNSGPPTAPSTTATPAPNRLTGSAKYEDPPDDAANGESGAAAPNLNVGADLTSASLSSDGKTLMMVFTHANPLPAQPLVNVRQGDLRIVGWNVAMESESGYSLVMITLTDTWEVKVSNTTVGQSADNTLNIVPQVKDRTLSVTIPLSELRWLGSPFKWHVFTIWGIQGSGEASSGTNYMDVLPGKGVENEPSSPESWVDFPQSNSQPQSGVDSSESSEWLPVTFDALRYHASKYEGKRISITGFVFSVSTVTVGGLTSTTILVWPLDAQNQDQAVCIVWEGDQSVSERSMIRVRGESWGLNREADPPLPLVYAQEIETEQMPTGSTIDQSWF
jgi:hypothetical protein